MLSVLLVGLIVITITSGCWNRRELNDLAVSVAIGIDQRGDRILLSDQILNPGAISSKQEAQSPRAPVNLFQETGSGIQEAARRMTRASTRKIYVGQLQMLIFGEEFAKQGLSKVLDHITRDHEYRKDFYVAVARGGEAQDILKVMTPLEKTPAFKLKSAMDVSSKEWGAIAAVKIDDLVSAIVSKGKEAVLTGVVVIGDPRVGNTKNNAEMIFPSARMQYSGVAVFKKDKLTGWLTEEQSRGYSYTQKKLKSTSVALSCPQDANHAILTELLRIDNDTKAVMKDDKPAVQLKIKTEGVISDAQCEMDFTKPSSVAELELMLQKNIQASVEAAVNVMQTKYKLDIFGFGEEVERKFPRYWIRVQDDWNEVFSTINVNVKVEAKIRQMFKTTKSFSERMGE